MAAVSTRPGRLQVALALLAVWIIWGATYVGIRLAVETMPSFLAAGSRFLLAALVLGTLVLLRGGGPAALRVSRRELVSCTVAAALLLGSVAAMMVAEQELASNLAALIGSGTACWVVLARVALRDRVPRGTLVGVPLGLAGLAVLLLAGRHGAVQATTAGIVGALCSSWLWTAGSVVAPRLELPRDMLVTSAWESLAGAVIFTPIGVATGELDGLSLGAISGRSWAGWLFLSLVGSVVAFTAYAWLLRNVSISTAVTNQYVNPIVALALGWLVLGEHLTGAMLLGGAMTIAAVVVILRAEARGRSTSP